MFRIHLLSDWLYDNLGPAVNDLYRGLAEGKYELPYYNPESQDNRPKLPSEAEPVKGCANCGSHETDLATWFKPLCTQCRTVRNLEPCVQCRNLFAKQDRVESSDNPGKYLCPVCAAGEHAE
jgi:hypothetical protein